MADHPKASSVRTDHRDLPRQKLKEEAERVVKMFGGPLRAQVFFKFTCAHCKERCTFEEANALWEEGECHKCGGITTVDVGGFMLSAGVGE